jgi:isopentenyl-diphosphate Delta-isomerase
VLVFGRITRSDGRERALACQPHKALLLTEISKRKDEHLDLATRGEVGFRSKTTLFECVQLVHDAMPELDLDEIDLEVRVLGRRLRAPLVLAGMTGGTERARAVNLELASIAEECGYGFGLGSQRAMLKDPSALGTYQVRSVAPSVLLLGNIGAVQAASMSSAEVAALVAAVAADALCVHLNPAMEVVQSEGDRNFRGVEATYQRLAAELPCPVFAKETGCGISAGVARRLAAVGVRDIDISGAGGTSWVAVEAQRAQPGDRELGQRFWDWGIPTAASLLLVQPCRFRTVIATGGIGNGLDAARALVLGAHAVGIARPVLQALDRGGRAEALRFVRGVERELRTALLLIGARNVAAAQQSPRVLSGELLHWQPLNADQRLRGGGG